jgi:2-polyprenyl-3-methyl-5-hydroxy-6-metoxy-1,4-benzoquinol methylase
LNVSGKKILAGNFDFVFPIGIIHHVPKPKPILDAAWRSLREDGRVLI